MIESMRAPRNYNRRNISQEFFFKFGRVMNTDVNGAVNILKRAVSSLVNQIGIKILAKLERIRVKDNLVPNFFCRILSPLGD